MFQVFSENQSMLRFINRIWHFLVNDNDTGMLMNQQNIRIYIDDTLIKKNI